MMPSAAQVANDLDAQGRYFERRDDDVSRLCHDTARLIRSFVAGERVDGRTLSGVHARLRNHGPRYPLDSQISKSLFRGMQTLIVLCQRTDMK
jgi:hypothetical protein